MKTKKYYIVLLIMLMGIMLLSGCGDTSNQNVETDDTDASFDEIDEDEAAADDDYPISVESMDMDGYLVTINTEGAGQVARAEVGRTFQFDEEYPMQSTADNLADGTKLIIGAKAEDGWKFEKWTLNGEDYSTDEQFAYTVTEDAAFVAVFAFEDSFGEETDDIGDDAEVSGLPVYVYEGDAKIAAICEYLVNDVAASFDAADVTIPYMKVVDTDDSDPDDTKVWGDFWVINYDLDGDVLEMASGGNYPGLMHLRKDADGSYTVTDFEVVEDGSDYLPSAQRIFGERYEDFARAQADNEAMEEIRAEFIRGYVESNGLHITAYQDYGWDPVNLGL